MGTRNFSRYHTNDWTEKKNGKKWELGIFLGITLMIELWTAANICKHLCKHLFEKRSLGFKIAFMKMRMKTMMMTERHFRESQRSSELQMTLRFLAWINHSSAYLFVPFCLPRYGYLSGFFTCRSWVVHRSRWPSLIYLVHRKSPIPELPFFFLYSL